MRRSLPAAVAAMAIAIIGVVATSATASPPSSDAGVPIVSVSYGGTTQSTDPTRSDYVSAQVGIQPASAEGVGIVAGFQYTFKGVTITVPSATLTHAINGSGLTINKEVAAYAAGGAIAAQICNWQIVFQNRYGSTIYSTRSTAVQEGCSYVTFSAYAQGPFTVKTGLQCARLYVNGNYRGEQCHNVFP